MVNGALRVAGCRLAVTVPEGVCYGSPGEGARDDVGAGTGRAGREKAG